MLTRSLAEKGLISIHPRARDRQTDITVRQGVVHALVHIDLQGVESHILRVSLQRGAELTLLVLSGHGKQHVIEQACTVAADAHLVWWNVTREDVQQSLNVRTSGAKAHVDVRWIARARKQERQELSVAVTHAACGGSGDVQVRCLSEDHGSIAVRGNIIIGKKAQGTEAFLDLQSIILDPKAQSKAIPAITVETNDVKAGHSATVSRIHPEDLFYLESRGLAPKEARKLFIDGFMNGLLSEMTDPRLRKYLR